MSLLFALLLVLTAVYESPGCDVKAPLPKNDLPLDMSKFNGTWYETLDSKDRISSDYACCTLKDVKVDPTGCKVLVTYYYENAPKRSFTADFETTEEGNFKRRTVEVNEVETNKYDKKGNFDSQAMRLYHEIEWQEFNFLGHPDHYLAYVECTSAGWVVWIVTREKVINTEQLVFIHNDLLKHGVSTPFRLGRCQNVIDK